MKVLIKETNENLKAIINTMKENLDSIVGVLENIQSQMDKKVEEAKKYKIQVDTAKENIRNIEEDNKNLEASLNEINEKYSKMNLVSLIEAGNKEIKAKINDNIKEINKNKEQIAELTSKARTIKDLLINLKKDKTVKEERLENIKKVYEFYNKNLNEIINYAYEHSDNLELFNYQTYNVETTAEESPYEEEYTYNELENTMVFDEIADIDENNNFKDEITFINNEIENNIVDTDYNKFVEEINDSVVENEETESTDSFNDVEINNEEPENDINLEDLASTQVFDSIMSPDYTFEEEENTVEEVKYEDIEPDFDPSFAPEIENEEELEENDMNSFDFDETEEFVEPENIVVDETIEDNLNINEDEKKFDLSFEDSPIFSTNFDLNENTQFDLTNNRLNEINDLLTIGNTKTESLELNGIEDKINNVSPELQIDTDLEEQKDATLTDIFGNPIKAEQLDESIKQAKEIEEIFVENGIDFNKFKDDEQNYLKQIYDENKFIGIFNILNKHKINVDNLYHSFNIFGEINFIELDNIINKLVSIGQSIESIGLILEKMPKIKKYNLDEAIASFNNDEIKNINLTDLIIKAKELYNGGNK